MKNEFFKDAITAINKGKTFAIFFHNSPDGDAIGSAKAVEHLLKNHGKKSYLYCEDDVSFECKFICDGFEQDQSKLCECDTYICLDVSGLNRVGKYADYLTDKNKSIIVIDHHVPQDNFGDIICRDSDASSTGELIYNLYTEMNEPIDKEAALYIYVAVSSDTGCFVQTNTKPSTFECASKLIQLGADTQKANYELFVKRPEGYINIAKYAFKNLQVFGDKLSLVTIDYKTYKKLGEPQSFYFIDALRFYPTDVLVVAIQKEKTFVKLSARSRNYNVQKLCEKLGGGGHINASGAGKEGKLKDIIKIIKKELNV